MNASVPVKVYLKKTCPFSLKLRIFLTEAGVADQADFVVFADGDATHQALRARMQAAGRSPVSRPRSSSPASSPRARMR